MTEYKHISQNGKETLLKDLALAHLKNIIAKAERLAEETGSKMFCLFKDSKDAVVDKDNFTGKKFLKLLKYEKYQMYVDELKRRQDNDQSNH